MYSLKTSKIIDLGSQLSNLLNNEVFQIRKFVEDEHDYIKIAQNYLEVWNS